MGKLTTARRVFLTLDYIFLIALGLLCVLPMLHVLAVSLSASAPASAGDVMLWPLGFNWRSYEFVANRPEFLRAFLISVQRLALGLPVCMLLTITAAYPMSKERGAFRARDFFAWFCMVTMLFSGGMIPLYIVVRNVGLIDSIWALILPGGVGVFNIILLLNFFRSLPRELEEAAFIDGAGHWSTLFRIFLPLSKPVLATITLFIAVGHWNSWFDGMIYMNSTDKYPLQTLLQTTVVALDSRIFSERDLDTLKYVSDRTTRSAEIFIAMVPVLLVYPFLQRYFTTGIVLGSVKG